MPKRRPIDEDEDEQSELGSPVREVLDEHEHRNQELKMATDATKAMWEKAREEKQARRQANECQPGSVMANAIHNHLGEPRKHEDVMVTIAGPFMGVIGKHSETRSAYGTYITAMYVPDCVKALFSIKKGEMVHVTDEDLEWYDDIYPDGGPLDAPAKEPEHNPMPYAVEMSIAKMMQDTNGSFPVLYVPPGHKARILRLFGGHTMEDFDKLYSFNTKIGAPYPKCFNSMMYYMNQTTLDELRDQWSKLSHDALLSDLFNIVQSAVRSRAGEKIWFE